MNKIREYFLNVDQAMSRFGLVDEYFASLERILKEEIEKMSKQKSNECQAELNRLVEEAKLNEQERERLAEQMRHHLTDWDTLGRAIRGVIEELRQMDQALNSVTVGRA
jgi:hypothetical protein